MGVEFFALARLIKRCLGICYRLLVQVKPIQFADVAALKVPRDNILEMRPSGCGVSVVRFPPSLASRHQHYSG